MAEGEALRAAEERAVVASNCAMLALEVAPAVLPVAKQVSCKCQVTVIGLFGADEEHSALSEALGGDSSAAKKTFSLSASMLKAASAEGPAPADIGDARLAKVKLDINGGSRARVTRVVRRYFNEKEIV